MMAGYGLQDAPRGRSGYRKQGLLMSSVRNFAIAGALAVIGAAAQADTGARGPAPTYSSGWAVMAGSSLKSALEGWCKAAGWTLIWDSPVDYRLRASANFQGSFEEAGSRLIDAIYVDNPEIVANFARINRVVHIRHDPLSSN